MKIAVRQRYPESAKELKIIRSYEEYVQFEIEQNDICHTKSEGVGTTQRVMELRNESARTIEALRKKQPVRIPEMEQKEQLSTNKDNSKYY